MQFKIIRPFILSFCFFVFADAIIYAQGTKNIDNGISLNAADSLYYARDWARAKMVYDKLLSDTSTDGMRLNRLAFSNFNLKNYEAAKKLYQRSLAQHPAPLLRASVYSRLARLNAFNNNTETTFANLDSAVAAGYNAYLELDTLADFNAIRPDERFKEIRRRVYGNRFPCMINPQAREFDFWVGDWDVYVTGTSNYAGHNTIQMISGGCALLENWENSAGTGKSINFIDPLTNKWKQAWVGSYPGGIQEFVNGEYKDSAMRFIFETIDGHGNKMIGRFIFYNEAPGRVRQFKETSADNGKTWVTSYDFTYIKKQ
ncbi:MAG: tetratricopeptide repeat protein [Ginsengibacter sp.]